MIGFSSNILASKNKTSKTPVILIGEPITNFLWNQTNDYS